MLLHGALDNTRFLVWGETPANKAIKLHDHPNRRAKIKAPPWYRFDPGADVVAEVLTQQGFSLKELSVDKIVLWLPSLAGRPLASSALVEEPPDTPGGIEIAPWSAFVLAPTSQALIELLCRCRDQPILTPGVVIADDLAYWATALGFAGALVAKQAVLPDIVRQGKACFARWRPVLSNRDAALQARLAAAMPHACRAASTETKPPERSAADVLGDFVGLAVDTLMRTAPPILPGENTTIDERWLAALRSPSGWLPGSAAELAQLSQRLQEWQRPATATLTGPFRLCFRLEEPILPEDATPLGADHGWTVRYLLQANDDPSLLIPVDEAWQARGRTATLFRKRGLNVKEFLLLALGQAARLWPLVEQSLQTELPSGFSTDTAGAMAFLTDTAAALEQAGFGVLLPAWWTGKGSKRRLAARAQVKSPRLQSSAGLSLHEIVKFEWRIALGEQTLTYKELMALAKLKTPLVKVRGQWVLLDAEEIQAAIALLKNKQNAVSAREVVKMALGGGSAPLPVEGVEAEGWIGEIVETLKERRTLAQLPLPAGFAGQLRPYQARGYAWLSFLGRWGLGACLADDMGLGKTVQTLVHIQHNKRQIGEPAPVLLVCPTSVINNWQHEAARFTPDLSVLIHHGGDRLKGSALSETVRSYDLVITSYGLLQRDAAALKKVRWAGVVLDEAQNIKNPETKQAKAARALDAGHRIALTGTPVENNVGDLWSLMEFLNPGFLGSQSAFKRNFFIPIQAGRDKDAAEGLKRLTGPFVLRRLKTDKAIIADLPEKLEMKVYCNLTQEQASLYAAVVEEALKELENSEGMQRRGLVLATLMKLKQVCNHPTQFLGDNSTIPDRSGKLARLTEMIEEILAVGERTLVFTQFTEMGEIIKNHLQNSFGREVLFLHGGVPKPKRDRLVTRFQSPDGPPVFLLSLKAGGTGLNLTAANHVFHFDRWWNPAVENQATDRAFRIGQTRQVEVHKFVCAGTLEEKIDTLIETKKTVAEAVVGSGEGWLTELSNEDLRELFALRAEAVAA